MKYSILQPLAGGFALGAAQAIGHKPEFILSDPAFSFNDNYLLKYWHNEIPYYNLNEVLEFDYDLDIVLSVPVCAGLSQLNSSKTRGADAPQNENMLFNSEYAMKKLKPKVFMFENAPALYTKIGEPVVQKLQKIASENGYVMSLYKTNTKFHGIPQNRKRTFAIFWRSEYCPLMEYENVSSNLVDYLNQIPRDASLQDTFVNENILDDVLYQYLDRKTEIKNVYAELKCTSLMNMLIRTELMDDFIEFCENENHEKEAKIAKHVKYKLSLDKGYWDNSLCFISGDYIGAIQGRMYGRIIHPNGDRDFSVRELIHLMGHPHNYEVDLKNINVIAQNVPVSTAKFITSQAMKFINDELPMTTEIFIKQDNNGKNAVCVSIDNFFKV